MAMLCMAEGNVCQLPSYASSIWILLSCLLSWLLVFPDLTPRSSPEPWTSIALVPGEKLFPWHKKRMYSHSSDFLPKRTGSSVGCCRHTISHSGALPPPHPSPPRDELPGMSHKDPALEYSTLPCQSADGAGTLLTPRRVAARDNDPQPPSLHHPGPCSPVAGTGGFPPWGNVPPFTTNQLISRMGACAWGYNLLHVVSDSCCIDSLPPSQTDGRWNSPLLLPVWRALQTGG